MIPCLSSSSSRLSLSCLSCISSSSLQILRRSPHQALTLACGQAFPSYDLPDQRGCERAALPVERHQMLALGRRQRVFHLATRYFGETGYQLEVKGEWTECRDRQDAPGRRIQLGDAGGDSGSHQVRQGEREWRVVGQLR